MANQFNYPDILINGFQRPSRIAAIDVELLSRTDQHSEQVLFGTSLKDIIEIWFYNPDGTFAAHMNVPPTSDNLKHTTIVDQTGAYEVLNINLQKIGLNSNLSPGQYGVVANLFSDEVGSEIGSKFYISSISPDRTELQLTPVSVTDEMRSDIYNFIVPGVPPESAKGLIDTIFGVAVSESSTDSITLQQVTAIINQITTTTIDRIQNAALGESYINIVRQVTRLAYKNIITMLENNFQNNRRVQKTELEQYIKVGLNQAINSLNTAGVIDPHFSVT